MKRVLFVNDEPQVLDDALRFRGSAVEWEFELARDGVDALARIGRQPYDVVVSDTCLKGMDGVKLMNEVMKRTPATVRIMLSNQQLQFLRSVGPAHQFLSKPCPPALLLSTIDKACALRELISDPQLQAIVSRVT